MKKAVYAGIRDVSVQEVPDPVPGPGEIKIKVKYCGICGSDLHEYLHGPFPNPVFGHEACGTIEALGPDVKGFTVGERVCTVIPESFAQYLVCPVQRAIKLPDDVDWQRAAVLEPLAGAAYAVKRGQVQSRDTVFIAGAGTVGLMFLLGCKAMDIEQVYMTDLLENRRQMAEKLGATLTWNPLDTKSSAKLKTLTRDLGVDVAIEAVGQEATLKDCLSSTKFRGTVIVQGIFTQRAQLHMLGFVTRETTMIGTASTDFPLAIQWLQNGKIQPEKIITHIIPLKDVVKGGFEVLAASGSKAVKILVEP